MADNDSGTSTSTFRKWFTPSKILIACIGLAVWAIVIAMTVDLVNKYLDSGRKEKTSLSREKVTRVEFPWVVVVDQVGTHCKAAISGCAFAHAVSSKFDSCNGLITKQKLTLDGDTTDTHLLNQTHAREKGLVFKTRLDFLLLIFTVFKEDPVTNVSKLVFNRAECRDDPATSEWMNVMLLPIADTALMASVTAGTAKAGDLATPVYLGLNHQTLLSFKLSQEYFVDGRVTNTSSYKSTQIYSSEKGPLDALGFNIIVQPDSFQVSQVKHLKGDSLVTLLGSVFGWVGVFTGTSIQGLLLAVIAFHQLRLHKAREKALDDREDILLAHEANAECRMTEMAVQKESAGGVASQEALQAVQKQLDELAAVVHKDKPRPPSFSYEPAKPTRTKFSL